VIWSSKKQKKFLNLQQFQVTTQTKS